MVILYVETNFIFSIAKGQEPLAIDLLQNTPKSVHLAIPNVCYIEALLRWQNEQKYGQNFINELLLRLNDAKRNLISEQARSLVTSLEITKSETEYLINDVKTRLYQTIDLLMNQAETIDFNPIIESTYQQMLGISKSPMINQDVMDNLILESILHHAQNHPEELKVFLSNNTKDFGKSVVQTALNNVGISHYFSKTQDFLGWLENQSF
jgi:PIN domain